MLIGLRGIGTLFFLGQPPRKRQDEASEVASAAEATNHHIRLLVDHVELFHRLQSDYRLMNQDVIQNTPETVGVARILLSLFQSSETAMPRLPT